MNLWAIIPLTSFVTFAVLFALVIQQAKTRVNRIFSVFLLASGVWSFFAFMLTSNISSSSHYLMFWNGLLIASMPLVVVTYYHFLRAYENKPSGFGVYIGYVIVLIVLAFCLKGDVVKNVYLKNGYLYHDIKPWNYIIAAIGIPYLAMTFYILFRRYRRSDEAIDRNKTAYLMAGWFILLVIVILLLSPRL